MDKSDPPTKFGLYKPVGHTVIAFASEAERQLAHAERDTVSAAYNFAEHLPERRRMMQSWADFLDTLKSTAEVVTLVRKSG